MRNLATVPPFYTHSSPSKNHYHTVLILQTNNLFILQVEWERPEVNFISVKKGHDEAVSVQKMLLFFHRANLKLRKFELRH